MKPCDPFDLRFSSREVPAWGGLSLLKRMLDGLDCRAGVQSWQLPPARLQPWGPTGVTHRADECQHLVWSSQIRTG
jgi:hypothetical protein